MSEPLLRLLPSGYYLCRWNHNLWLQWPRGREPRMEDGFGFITEAHVREAARMLEEEQDGQN